MALCPQHILEWTMDNAGQDFGESAVDSRTGAGWSVEEISYLYAQDIYEGIPQADVTGLLSYGIRGLLVPKQ